MGSGGAGICTVVVVKLLVVGVVANGVVLPHVVGEELAGACCDATRGTISRRQVGRGAEFVELLLQLRVVLVVVILVFLKEGSIAHLTDFALGEPGGGAPVRGVVQNAQVDNVVVQVYEHDASRTVGGLSFGEVLGVEANQERDGGIEYVGHRGGHYGNVCTLPHEGEKELEEGLGSGGEEGVVL